MKTPETLETCTTHREIASFLKRYFFNNPPTDEFLRIWLDKAQVYPLDDVKFVANLQMEKAFFPSWDSWHGLLDAKKEERERRQEQLYEREKPRPEDYKDYRTVWKAHLNKWLDGEITFYQYMTEGLKIGLIHPFEYNKEIARRIKHNKPGYLYFKNPLSIIERR